MGTLLPCDSGYRLIDDDEGDRCKWIEAGRVEVLGCGIASRYEGEGDDDKDGDLKGEKTADSGLRGALVPVPASDWWLAPSLKGGLSMMEST